MNSLLSSAVLKISKLSDVVFLYLSYLKDILQTMSPGNAFCTIFHVNFISSFQITQ